MELVPIVFTILIYSFGGLMVVLLLSVIGNKLFVAKVEVPLPNTAYKQVLKPTTSVKSVHKKTHSEYKDGHERKRAERERLERKERSRISTKEKSYKQKELNKKLKGSAYHKRYVIVNQLDTLKGSELPSREQVKRTFYPVVVSQYKTNIAPNYKIESQ